MGSSPDGQQASLSGSKSRSYLLAPSRIFLAVALLASNTLAENAKCDRSAEPRERRFLAGSQRNFPHKHMATMLRGGMAKRRTKHSSHGTSEQRKVQSQHKAPKAAVVEDKPEVERKPKIWASDPRAAELLAGLHGNSVKESSIVMMDGKKAPTMAELGLPTGFKHENRTAQHLAFLNLLKNNKTKDFLVCDPMPLDVQPDPGILVSDAGIKNVSEMRTAIGWRLKSAFLEGCELYDISPIPAVESLFGDVYDVAKNAIPDGRDGIRVVTHIKLSGSSSLLRKYNNWVRDRGNVEQEITAQMKATLKRTHLSYVDVAVLHWPKTLNETEITKAWGIMEDLYRKNLARSIGIFGVPKDLARFLDHRPIRPMLLALDSRYGFVSEQELGSQELKWTQVAVTLPVSKRRLPPPIPAIARDLMLESTMDLVRAASMGINVATFHPIQGMRAREEDLEQVVKAYGRPMRHRLFDAMARLLPLLATIALLQTKEFGTTIANIPLVESSRTFASKITRTVFPALCSSAKFQNQLAILTIFSGAFILDQILPQTRLLPRSLATAPALSSTTLLLYFLFLHSRQTNTDFSQICETVLLKASLLSNYASSTMSGGFKYFKDRCSSYFRCAEGLVHHSLSKILDSEIMKKMKVGRGVSIPSLQGKQI
eukprot:jgi/Bigna1/85097/estExt_fgenesh1_pg.C_20160